MSASSLEEATAAHAAAVAAVNAGGATTVPW